MRLIPLHNALRRATVSVAAAILFCLSAVGQEVIDLAKIPVLCNRTHVFKLKEVRPNGYVYYYNNDSTEIVLTRDNERINRYTSKFPEAPYIMSCDYEVKRLGTTVTMIAYLAQYQEKNPYYSLFAADSHEEYIEKWEKRAEGGADNCDWLFSVPIDEYFIYYFSIEQLKQMRSRLEAAGQADALLRFNINQLDMAISSEEEGGDCGAD